MCSLFHSLHFTNGHLVKTHTKHELGGVILDCPMFIQLHQCQKACFFCVLKQIPSEFSVKEAKY